MRFNGHILVFIFVIIITLNLSAQNIGIGTGTPHSSAKLEVNSSNSGLLFPRLTVAQRDAIQNPAAGLAIYCTNCGEFGQMQYFNGNTWRSMDMGLAANFILPQVSTTQITNISSTSATAWGTVSTNNGSVITGRGVCWSTNPDPTIADEVSVSGSGAGTFSVDMNNLLPNTTYYVRAYATNSFGTFYGNTLVFNTYLLNEHVVNLLVNGSPTGGNYTMFSFAERNPVVNADSNSLKWDFGLRFETFIINSNASGPGNAYVQILDQPFSDVLEAPLSGYKYDTSATQKAIKGSDWYSYNPTTRQFAPKAGKTFVFVTATGKYAKMEILKTEPSDDNGNPVVPPTRPTKIIYTLRCYYQPDGSRFFLQ